MTEEKKPSEIVKKTENHPCGCIETTFADDRTSVNPCPPHAIAEAGRLMASAGQMLNMAAGRLLHDQQQMIAQQISDAVKKSGGPKGIIT